MSLKKCLRSKNRTQYWRQLGRNSVKNQRQKIGEGKLQQRDTKGYQVKFYKLLLAPGEFRQKESGENSQFEPD